MVKALEEVVTLIAVVALALSSASVIILHSLPPQTLKEDIEGCIEHEGVCKLVFRLQVKVVCSGSCLTICSFGECYKTCIEKELVCGISGHVNCIIIYSNSTHVVIYGCRGR